MKYEVLKKCRISGRDLQVGAVLELDKDITVARADKGVKDGNLKAGGGHGKTSESGKGK